MYLGWYYFFMVYKTSRPTPNRSMDMDRRLKKMEKKEREMKDTALRLLHCLDELDSSNFNFREVDAVLNASRRSHTKTVEGTPLPLFGKEHLDHLVDEGYLDTDEGRYWVLHLPEDLPYSEEYAEL
jgi:hypothetical protein